MLTNGLSVATERDTTMLALQTSAAASNDTHTQLVPFTTPMTEGAIGQSVMDAQIRTKLTAKS